MKISESPLAKHIISTLDRHHLKPGDFLETNVTANKKEVQIVFRIIKGSKPKKAAP